MTTTADVYPFADLALSCRLERAEGRGSVDFVETRARMRPESGARWIEVAGAYVMYDGPTSPITQTFGLGLFQPVTPPDLDRIEGFFRECGAPVFHEVSPLAGIATLTLLCQRGYQPVELTSVMFRPIRPGLHLAAPRDDRIRARPIEEHEHERWAQTAARGWSEYTEFADMMMELSRVSAGRRGGPSFLAELDGQPIGAGALCLWEGVALLAGASTIPEARKQGAQLALLDARLSYAAEHGCDLAMMCAAPGSGSQRNAERQGFRIAYTRVKWRLPQPSV